MRAPKKPPPDTVENVRGRIRLLKISAKQNASMDVKDGADKDRALAKHMKAIEPALKKLQRRLERARKAQGTKPAAPSGDRVSSKKKGRKKAKKATASHAAKKGDDDLLSKLDSL